MTNSADEFYPIKRSLRCFNKTDTASCTERVQAARLIITGAIDKFNNINKESVPDPRDRRFNINALDHWIQHDPDLRTDAYDYFMEIRDRLNESLEIAGKYLSQESAAGNGGAMPKPSNPLAQGGLMDQISNRHIGTEAWVRDQE